MKAQRAKDNIINLEFSDLISDLIAQYKDMKANGIEKLAEFGICPIFIVTVETRLSAAAISPPFFELNKAVIL